MKVLWITAVFLSLSAGAEICSTCLDMPIHCITTRGSTSVSCPNVTGGEVKFSLLRNKSEVGFAVTKQGHTETKGPVRFEEPKANGTARFILSQLDVNSTGVYTCDIEKMYPPPYSKSLGRDNMVIVQEAPQGKEYLQEDPPKTWIWAALGVMAAYSLIVTGIAVGLWHNLKNKQTLQHDYMNMKPRVMRKKQGVQHPVRTGKY